MSFDAVDSRSSGGVMKLVVLPSRILLLEQYNMYMYAYRLVFRISHDSRACGMPRLTRLSRVCGKDQSAFHGSGALGQPRVPNFTSDFRFEFRGQ